MRLCCPAKINLHLRVGRRRADGFHPLLTWMATVGLFDTLTLNTAVTPEGEEPTSTAAAAAAAPSGAAAPVASPAAGDVIRLETDAPGLPCDATNLVVRAALAFAAATGNDRRAAGRAARAGGERTGVGAADASAGRHRAWVDGEVTRVRPVGATLAKRIPAGAGLGGGSSDAARTLEGLNVLWHARWPTDRLSELAATLGSDVPFFLHGPSSVCTGRGEHVRPVRAPTVARWAVLVLPDVHMPTADVYRRFDALDLGSDDEIARPPDWSEWASRPAGELMPRLVNDLERPAFEIRPELGMLRERIELALRRPVRMSGSGSSLFTLCDERPEAEAWAGTVAGNFGARATAVQLCPVVADDLNGTFARA